MGGIELFLTDKTHSCLNQEWSQELIKINIFINDESLIEIRKGLQYKFRLEIPFR